MVTGPAPRRMTFKGAEVIVLEPEVYAQLDASRRQLGAKMHQVGSLKRQLQTAVELLDLLDHQVEEMPGCDRSEPGDGACCPKHALAVLLAGRAAQSVRDGARSGRGNRRAGPTG